MGEETDSIAGEPATSWPEKEPFHVEHRVVQKALSCIQTTQSFPSGKKVILYTVFELL